MAKKRRITKKCTFATGAGAPAAVQEGLQAAETENIDSGLENMTNAAMLGMRNTLCKKTPRRCLSNDDACFWPAGEKGEKLQPLLPQRTRRSSAAAALEERSRGRREQLQTGFLYSCWSHEEAALWESAHCDIIERVIRSMILLLDYRSPFVMSQREQLLIWCHHKDMWAPYDITNGATTLLPIADPDLCEPLMA